MLPIGAARRVRIEPMKPHRHRCRIAGERRDHYRDGSPLCAGGRLG